jgi:WD40 repeat protein
MSTRSRAIVLAVAVALAAVLGVVGALFLTDSSEPTSDSAIRELRLAIQTIPSSSGGDAVTAAGLSGEGLLALATSDGHVSIVDGALEPWQGGWERRAGTSPVSHLAFSPDGSALAAATSGALLVWRVDTQEETSIPIEGVPSAIALSSEGRLLAATSFDILVFDVAAERLVTTFAQDVVTGGIGEYQSVAFSPDSQTVVAASLDGIDAWDLGTRERTRPSLPCACGADGSALTRDARLATFGTTDAHVLLWNVDSATLLADETVSAEPGDHVYGNAASLDGQYVLAGTASGRIVVWEPGTDVRIDQVRPSGQPIVRAEASDDGRVFLVEGQKADLDAEPGERDRWLITITER